MKCQRCEKTLSEGNKSGFCQRCLIQYSSEIKLKTWLETGDTGFTVDTTIRGVIRDYILEKQEHKCAICGMTDIWNNMPINFVLDHIDGDASNSCPNNVRLVCPNCDSQLPTFKSRNKNSARNKRKEYLNETVPRLKNE